MLYLILLTQQNNPNRRAIMRSAIELKFQLNKNYEFYRSYDVFSLRDSRINLQIQKTM